MIEVFADNIISPLGLSTDENWYYVQQGKSALKTYDKIFDLPDAYCVSQIDYEMVAAPFYHLCPMLSHYTKLEQMAILSVAEALSHAPSINVNSSRVIFIVSTTKGNVDLLDDEKHQDDLYLWQTAQKIAEFYLNPNHPMVVSNACISGTAALITAQRLIESGQYDYAVVVGVDVLSKFVLSGFQSFKALSPTCCKPFDADRCGLNLGEAAATMIVGKAPNRADLPHLVAGAMANDANHISGPSREALGLTNSIRKALDNAGDVKLAFAAMHGTATRYNDDMESIALQNCGLSELPAYSLKSYFGHTLGAAGILETILAFRALKEQKVPATLNFEAPGTTAPMCVSAQTQEVKGNAFLKLMSGFGGSNAAVVGTL